MKSPFHLVWVAAIFTLAVVVSGCDLGDAVTATKSMPDKIDRTNDQVSVTNGKMDEMKAELEAMRAVTQTMAGAMEDMLQTMLSMQQSMEALLKSMIELSGKIDDTNTTVAETNRKIEETNRKIDETNRAMATMKSAIHKQTLQAALTEMSKPENTRFLFPPTSMMAPGRIFAEEATDFEITQLVYVYLKDIDEVQPDDSLKGADGKFPDSVIAEIDHGKLAKFTILEVIAGLMPQEKVQAAVDTQVTGGGRYYETVYSLLMLRTLFVRDILIGEDLFAKKLDDLGKVEEAIDRVSYLDWIARLPFASEIGIKTLGMLKPDDNISETLDPRMTIPMWDHLARSLDTELDPAKVGSSPQAQAKLAALKDKVKRYQESWKPVASVLSLHLN